MAKGTLQVAYDKLLLENLGLKERITELEAENKQLKKQIGDLRAAALRKALMKGGSFTGKH